MNWKLKLKIIEIIVSKYCHNNFFSSISKCLLLWFSNNQNKFIDHIDCAFSHSLSILLYFAKLSAFSACQWVSDLIGFTKIKVISLLLHCLYLNSSAFGGCHRQENYCYNLTTRVISIFIVSKSDLSHFSMDPVT